MLSKKSVLMVILLVFVFSGCAAMKGFSSGLKEDLSNTWNNVKDLDKNFKENWW